MRFYLLSFMIILWSGCAGLSDSQRDSRADSALGLAAQGQEDDNYTEDQEARKALMDEQEHQGQEQKNLLNRQITDPLA